MLSVPAAVRSRTPERLISRRFPALNLLLLLALLAGCKSGDRLAYVDRLLVNDADLVSQRLGLTSQEVAASAREALGEHGRIGLLEPGDARGDDPPWQGRVELVYVRTLPPMVAPAEGNGMQPMRAEVAVELALTRGAGSRIVGEGRAQQEFASGGAEAARAEAFAQALDDALAEAAKQVALHLETAGKADDALVADLEAGDVQRREYALRILAERKSPVAVPHLLERLEDADRTVQLRAVGGLVAVGDRRAVPQLIDVSLGRDPPFVIQVIYALAEIGGEEAEAYLFTASTGHQEEIVRDAAKEALDSLRAEKLAAASPVPKR